ncbi:hypothetical protein ACGI6H_29965, partial [Escherichia coli]
APVRCHCHFFPVLRDVFRERNLSPFRDRCIAMLRLQNQASGLAFCLPRWLRTTDGVVFIDDLIQP